MAGKLVSRTLTGVALLVAAASLDAAQYLIVTRDANGAWGLKEAEEITVNGKTKVRTAPPAPGAADSWDSKSLGHLQAEPMENAAVVVHAADGKLYTRGADEGAWALLLPESVGGKQAQSSADIWRGATIAMKADRKEKVATPLPLRGNLRDLLRTRPCRLSRSTGNRRLAAQIPRRRVCRGIPPNVGVHPGGGKGLPFRVPR